MKKTPKFPKATKIEPQKLGYVIEGKPGIWRCTGMGAKARKGVVIATLTHTLAQDPAMFADI